MKLNKKELLSVLSIGIIIALRLLGIFLILPVFSIYTTSYPGSSLALAGVAFGIYALTQSLLQIPFGLASDKFGRKPVLIFGLLIFAVGSLLCGFADNIYELIFARAIQGSGAVGSVAIASLGDSTRDKVRAQAFTITGIMIGAAFIISLVIGPVLASKLGFKSLFFILSFLGIVAIMVTTLGFPKIEVKGQAADNISFFKRLKNIEIRKLFLATFIISFVLNLFLFIYPLSWKNLDFDLDKFWIVYLIILSPSALFVYPYIRIAEKREKLMLPLYIGHFFLILGITIYIFKSGSSTALYLSGAAFFLGHSLFQSLLPTFLTQRISSRNRGTSSGFFNLANSFGAALGGMLAGKLYDTYSLLPLFLGIALLFLWIYIGLPHPPINSNID
ncbi:MAG: MFS transporter [Thermodesulfobacteriota bacterium]